MARLTGLEPATSGVTGRHSNQLSYNRPLPARDRAQACCASYARGPAPSSSPGVKIAASAPMPPARLPPS